MADYLNIAGRVRTTASDGVAMEAQEVKDLNQNKSQQEINADVQTELGDRYTKEETYSKEQVNDLITTPDANYVNVVATIATTAVTDILPVTGEANTIYRVGNWNGTQYDPTMYALFAWNGSAYVCLAVRSFVGEVYDVSVNHPDGQGNPIPYADLDAALGTDGANIPADIRRGGMSIKFIQGTVQSSDNKYVQFRLMSQTFSTTVTDWQGVDDEPTTGSRNLVESGGVKKCFDNIMARIGDVSVEMQDYNTTQKRAYIYGDFKSGDKITFSAKGTATTATSSIQVRLDDEVSTVAYLTNNGDSRTITLEVDTEYFCILILKSNITSDGTININLKAGINIQLEETNKNVTKNAQDILTVKAEDEKINTTIGVDLKKQLESYSETQERAYIYGNFKSGDTLALSAFGTAVTTTSGILVRLDDVTTTIAYLTNNGPTRTIELASDTTCLVFIINKSNITTSGTIVAAISTGIDKRINDLNEQVENIDNNKKISIQKEGQSLISASSFVETGYINQYDNIQTSSTYYHSDYISVCENSTYAYTGSLSGSACILAYTENKRAIKVWDNSASISNLIMPSNARYLRISTNNTNVTLKPLQTYIRKSDIVTATYQVDKTNSTIIKSGNEIQINNSEFANRWRLVSKFKINGYIEGVGELKICELQGLDTYEIGVDGQQNARLSLTTGEGITSIYPIPKRNSKYFSRKNELLRQQTEELSLPAYKEIIGKDLFTLQYIGVASQYDYDIDNANVQSSYASLSDNLFLSLINNTLSVWAGSTTYIEINIGDFTNIGQLVDYINANYTDFKAELIADSTITVDNIAPITEVALVSQYQSVYISNPTTRYDAFKCYFNAKDDETIHTLELVSDYGYIYAKIDGIRVGQNCPFIGAITNIKLGLNGVNNSITIVDYDIIINSIGDCELYTEFNSTNNTFWSSNSPRIIVLEGHGIYDGDSCNGKTPIYVDETPTSEQASVIPVSMRQVFTNYGVVTSIVTSTHKLDSIFKYAKEKGYEFVSVNDFRKLYNGGKLPSKCFTMIFDDANQYFYDILSIRNVFSENGICPVLATQYTIDDISNEAYIKKHQSMLNNKWEIVMHGLDAINVSTMSSTQLYDQTSSDTTKHRMMNIQRSTAEQLLISWDIWVYSNGAANPNVIKSFGRSGEILGFMTPFDGGSPIENGKNRYYLSRVNVNEKTPLQSILNNFL